MNIDDVDAGENPIKSLEDIFAHQRELYLKYKEMEGMDWAGDTVNIHTLKGQKWLKDFLWRTTEELAESFEAHISNDENGEKHAIEELADALHFFIEFCILAGITPEDLFSLESLDPELGIAGEHQSVISQYWHATYALGLIGNTLKNKPWKKHQMKTDENKFKDLTKRAFIELIDCFFIHKVKPEGIYDFYFRKNAVNQFRQRSNY